MLKRDPRKSYHYGDLAEAMVEQGTAEVERDGIGGLSMRRVAESLNVSSAAPWHHFPNRASFAAAIAEGGFRKLRLQLERKRAQAKSATDTLAQAFQGYTRFAIDNPGLYRAMFSFEISEGLERVDMTNPGTDKHFVALLAEKALMFNLFVELVRDGQEGGEVRLGDPAQLARVVASLAHGLALEFIDERLGSRTSRRKEADAMFGILLDGIGTPRRHIRVIPLKGEDEAADYRHLSPAERIGMIRELSEIGYAFAGKPNVIPGSSRPVVRVYTRKS